MRKILNMLFACLLSMQVFSQSKLVRGEFYWDTDPGFGQGLALADLDSLLTIDSTLLINISDLSPGNHILYVRFLDDNTVWSQSYAQNITIAPENYNPGEDTRDVRKLEYYWDNGPLSELPVNGVIDFEFTSNISTNDLGTGNHKLNYRVKDAYGFWSIWQSQNVFIHGEAPGINIAKIEYFIGEDPGIDQGTSVSFAPANSTDVNAEFEAPTAGIAQGINIITIRTKDVQGNWSAFYSSAFDNDNSYSLSAGVISPASYCAGANIVVPFTKTGEFSPDKNQFKIQLSDVNGNNFTDLNTSINGNNLEASLPELTPVGNTFKVRVVSTLPYIKSLSSTTLSINTKPTGFMSGSQTINFGNSATVYINVSGSLPSTVVVAGQNYIVNTASHPINVTPTVTTHYAISSISNVCGTGSIISGPAIITVPCPTNITHGTGTLQATVYQASNTIVSQKKAINVDLSYKAGKSITLSAGFEASGNKVFLAQIGGCF